MDDEYLAFGLSAMATAGEPFMAHFGAALLAGWWFARDLGAASDLDQAITRTADQVIAKHRWLFGESASSHSNAALGSDLVEHVGGGHLDDVWAIGHDVIFTALAVRTFQARPELCTGRKDLDPLSVDAPDEVARVALETIVDVTHVYAGLHQGDIGHVMDHAHALISLDRLGYRAESNRGRRGFLTHVAALRKFAHEEVDLLEVTVGVGDEARQPAYWEHDYSANDWAVGHVFKYPYALYDLLALVDDSALAARSIRRVGQLIVDSHSGGCL